MIILDLNQLKINKLVRCLLLTEPIIPSLTIILVDKLLHPNQSQCLLIIMQSTFKKLNSKDQHLQTFQINDYFKKNSRLVPIMSSILSITLLNSQHHLPITTMYLEISNDLHPKQIKLNLLLTIRTLIITIKSKPFLLTIHASIMISRMNRHPFSNLYSKTHLLDNH